MGNKKRAVGIAVQNAETLCEILEADGSTIRYRTTFQGGDVFENLWSPNNPTFQIEGDPQPLPRVRTWRNGVELPITQSFMYDYKDHCLCTVLGSLYGDDFTGYEHNYRFEGGYVMPDDE